MIVAAQMSAAVYMECSGETCASWSTRKLESTVLMERGVRQNACQANGQGRMVGKNKQVIDLRHAPPRSG